MSFLKHLHFEFCNLHNYIPCISFDITSFHGTADIEDIYIERADIGLDNIISLHMARAIESKVNMRYRYGCKKLDHFND